MVKKLLYLFCCFALIDLSAFSQQTYQIDKFFNSSCPADNKHSLILKIPKGVDVVKGILINGNAGCSTTLYYVEDQLAYEFAKKINFAIMGTYNWGSFWETGEFETFEDCFSQLSEMSGHSELVDAPFLFFGHSNGGMMTHNYSALRPEKCIAALVNKGGSYNESLPGTETLKTPTIFVAGERDWPGIADQIETHFYANRPRVALWSHILQQGWGHVLVGETIELYYLLAEEALKRRYPEDQSPIDGPVTLLDLDVEAGWLSDSTTWKNGIIEVFDHDNYPNSIDSSSWHINKDLAYLFAAHSSYDRIDTKAYFPENVADSGSVSTFHFEVKEPWDSIHVYNKSSIVGSYYNSVDTIFDFEVSLDSLGFYALFAQVYLSSGETSITNFDVVLVVKEVEEVDIVDTDVSDIIEKNTNLIFYPNPCSNKGYLSSDKQIKSYILYSIDGKRILYKKDINTVELEIDLSFLYKGTYILKAFFDNDEFEVIKIIK